MGFPARIRRAAAPPSVPAPPVVPAGTAFAGPELGDDELERVVGGLERVYLPGPVSAG